MVDSCRCGRPDKRRAAGPARGDSRHTSRPDEMRYDICEPHIRHRKLFRGFQNLFARMSSARGAYTATYSCVECVRPYSCSCAVYTRYSCIKLSLRVQYILCTPDRRCASSDSGQWPAQWSHSTQGRTMCHDSRAHARAAGGVQGGVPISRVPSRSTDRSRHASTIEPGGANGI